MILVSMPGLVQGQVLIYGRVPAVSQITLHLGVGNVANLILVNVLGSYGARSCPLLHLESQLAPLVVALRPARGLVFSGASITGGRPYDGRGLQGLGEPVFFLFCFFC